VNRILGEHKGLDQVSVYLKKEKAVKKLNQEQAVNVNNALLTTLNGLLGEKNVKVTYKVLKKIQN
jgi:DNA polymerase-3 subunit alpha